MITGHLCQLCFPFSHRLASSTSFYYPIHTYSKSFLSISFYSFYGHNKYEVFPKLPPFTFQTITIILLPWKLPFCKSAYLLPQILSHILSSHFPLHRHYDAGQKYASPKSILLLLPVLKKNQTVDGCLF